MNRFGIAGGRNPLRRRTPAVLATLLACASLLPGAAPADSAPPLALGPRDPGSDGPRVSVADPDLVRGYVETLQATRTALADYRWRARASIRVDDREWLVELFDVGLDRDGRLRHTLIGHEVEDPALEGPLRRRVRPLDDPAPAAGGAPLPAGEQAAALKRLAESYAHPEPADVRRVPLLPAPLIALQPLEPPGPTRSPVPVPPGDAATAESGFVLYDLIREGDSCQVWLDDGDGRPARLEARTDLEGAPVEVRAEYSRLPDGTAYLARTTITSVVEKHPIEIRIDAFGFDKRSPAH